MERVECDIAEGKDSMEAANETGPDGALVGDNKLAPDHGHCQCYPYM